MNYSKLIRNHGDYFDDLEDTDLFVFAEGLLSVPALQPTGNWRQDLRSYLANRAPRNGCKLRPRGKSVTGMGFALTLPKCVCILELLNVDPRITAAVLKAAKVCLVLVELLATRLKQRPDGIRRSQVVAFAAFQRLTDGSLPMPHRHVHLGVLSLAWNDATRFQRVTSANLEVVSHSGDLLQTLFQHQVASELRQLGYGIEQEKESFTIAGFPEDVMRGFCAGPRRRQGQKQDLRPAGTFQAMQDHWRSRLSAAEQLTLQGLRTQGVPGQSEPSFAGQLKTAAEQALEKDFFCAAGNIAAQATPRLPAQAAAFGLVLGTVIRSARGLWPLPRRPVPAAHGGPPCASCEVEIARVHSGVLLTPAPTAAAWIVRPGCHLANVSSNLTGSFSSGERLD
jgi:conjugative relaxase-like TrwC/TraI family protein